MMFRILLLVAVFGLTAVAARANDAPAPSLRADVTVADSLVRVGDLVQNPGAASEIPIFRSPDLGQTGIVPVHRIIEALRPHGLADIDTRGLKEIAVTRAAREIGLKEIESEITGTFAGSHGLGPAADLSLVFDREAEPILIEPSAGELQIARTHYDRYSGRFDVTFTLPGSVEAQRRRLRLTGRVIETVEVATPVRPLSRGDLIRASDIAVERQPKASVRAGTFAAVDQIVGLAARRPLRPGQMLQAADVMKPELVVKNEAVSIFYQMPGMMLTVRGKALESGAVGDLVSVFNVQTKRTLQGVVIGPGRVNLVTTFASAAAPDVTGSVAARPSSQRTE